MNEIKADSKDNQVVMTYESPSIIKLTMQEIQDMVADCVTCQSFFRCGSLFVG